MTRLKIFQIIIILVALIIIFRLFYWQFINPQISKNSLKDESEIPASRGEIIASDGFPLVTNQEAFLIYAKPHEVKNPQETAKFLSQFLISEKYATVSAQLSEEELKKKETEKEEITNQLSSKLNNKNLFWIQLARKVLLKSKEEIEQLKITGLGFERDEKRFYPESSMSAQLLGFVGFDKFGQDTGYFGLEGYWDKTLKGKNGRLGQEKDPFGLPILVGKYRRVEPTKGSSIHLSIDRVIQFIVEEKLARAVEKYGAKDGSVVVANPNTGQILAMATYPSYNATLRQEYDEKLFRNPVVGDSFEPGSIFKVIAMASAIDAGVLDPNTKCDICAGPRQLGGFEISTWNKKYHPDSTMTEVIQNSDNIGMSFVADRLKLDKFFEYIQKFGFGKTTGIDLQEESPGTIRDKDEWRPIDLATASFGQGIAVTPIQMIQAVSVIANGGKLITPRVVTKITNNDRTEEIKPKVEKQIISSKTSFQLTEMMVNAVEKGEAKAFIPKGYRIAGKTGTAQIPISGHYDPNKTIASFVGFAPADNPKFIMLVRFTEPSSSPFGSETAAPTFFEIAKEIFNYMGVPPKN